MSCNNCYNGCAETTSDKCVKYTGSDIESLGINNGDSLYSVDGVILDKLVTLIDGTGIDITIDPTAYCELVTKYLPSCKPICNPPTAVELFEALVKAACDLQTQVDDVVADIAILNADYDVDCLSGVTNSSDTHAVLQATITKLCELGVDLSALALDVETNYVKLADLDALIQAYLDTLVTTTQQYTKMVPYTAVEYYGSLSYFDGTGAGNAGLGWDKIYLCNGLNGTPDKRGRVAVGAIQTVPGPSLGSAVNPAIAGNPNYAVGDTAGTNTITLDATQIPTHTHTATVTDTHYHYEFANTVNSTDIVVDSSNQVARALAGGSIGNPEYSMNSTPLPATVGKTGTTQGTLSVSNSSVGGGLAHSNIQPVLACYYIMYIP